jgi:SSS family solute:Na+ symporter
VLVGQIATVVLVGFGLLWIPMMQLISGQIYQYLQSVQAYISPPIAAAFLIGVWQRVNTQGAIAAFAVGFVLGIGRLVAELNKDALSGFLYWYSDINFLYFAFFLFVVCSVVLVLVSFVTPEPSARHIAGLTFQTADQEPERAEAFAIPDAQEHLPDVTSDPAWRRTDLLLSVLLAIIVGAIWLYFTG